MNKIWGDFFLFFLSFFGYVCHSYRKHIIQDSSLFPPSFFFLSRNNLFQLFLIFILILWILLYSCCLWISELCCWCPILEMNFPSLFMSPFSPPQTSFIPAPPPPSLSRAVTSVLWLDQYLVVILLQPCKYFLWPAKLIYDYTSFPLKILCFFCDW